MNLKDMIIELEETQAASKDIRDNSRECETFCEKKNGQWEKSVWTKFDGKPRYTFDKTNHIVDLICSGIETKSFGIKLSPATTDTSQSLAEVMTGIIRNMQYQSKAQDIYNRAMRRCIKTGFDAWRVNTRWKKGTFEQEPYIEYIPDSLDKVWFDKNSTNPDASDAKWCWVMTQISKAEFEKRFPGKGAASLPTGRTNEEYTDKPDGVIVGEYLFSKEKELKITLLKNGHIVNSDQKNYADMISVYGEDRTRSEKTYKWYSRKFSADDWLEDERETVFKSCPVIPVYGNFDVSDGKVICRGVVERLMDPQRVLNYAKSREIEEGALQPRRMWWMTTSMAGDVNNQRRLSQMNTSSNPVQFYEIDPKNPQLTPFQAGTNEINPHLSNLSATMAQDIEAAAGKFGVALGKNTGLQSGVALDIQNDQGRLGDVKWEQVLARAIRRTADVIIEIIPAIMDTHQSVQSMSESMKQSVVELNKPIGGGKIENDISNANFSVVVDITDNFDTRQRETIQGILEVAAIKPDVLDQGADILFSSFNFPGSRELADRVRNSMLNRGMIPESQMTDEEKKQMLAMAQQPAQPDAAMVMAQAEMMKAQADMVGEENKRLQLELEMQKVNQSGYKVAIEEQRAAADIANTNADTLKKVAETEKISGEVVGTQMDNISRLLPQ